MSSVERLDFSKPPPGYLVWFDDEWQCVCWGLEDDGLALNDPDDGLTEETAIAAAWAHRRGRRLPSVERLDFSKPPPGYALERLEDGMWWWGETDEWLDGTSYVDRRDAIAAAWAHYKARHDDGSGETQEDDHV